MELEKSITISPNKKILDRNLLVNELLAKQRRRQQLNTKQAADHFESKMKIFEGIKSFIKSSHLIKNLNVLDKIDPLKEKYTQD